MKFPKGSVCKPCWELHYCPYGYLVEMFPGAGGNIEKAEVIQRHEEAIQFLTNGQAKTKEEVFDAVTQATYWQPNNWEEMNQYSPEEVNCRVFGHLCPVFLAQSGASETKKTRSQSRLIPREIMFKVVRRDNHVCQLCSEYVADDKIEFDHIIPYSKGGPTTVENLRLLCKPCNRKKSDSLSELIEWPRIVKSSSSKTKEQK